MFCNKCGAQLNNDERFCYQCGAPVADQSQEIASVKKQKPLWPFILVLAVILLVLVGLLVYKFAFGNTEKKYNDQLALAERYLDELDYDKAIAAYYTAIDIDPYNSEAYIQLSRLYEKIDDQESALKVLKEACSKTDDSNIRKRIKRVEETIESVEAEAEKKVMEAHPEDVEEDSDAVEDISEEAASEDQTDAESQEQAPTGYYAWKEAYRDLIIQEYDEWERALNGADYRWDLFRGVAFVYLDDDDIPELFTQHETGTESGYDTRIYTYKDGKITKLTAKTYEADCGGPDDCLPIEGYMERKGMLVTRHTSDYHLEEILFQLNGDHLDCLAYYKGEPHYSETSEEVYMQYSKGNGDVQTVWMSYDEYFEFQQNFWAEMKSLYGYEYSNPNYVTDANFMLKQDALEWLR